MNSDFLPGLLDRPLVSLGDTTVTGGAALVAFLILALSWIAVALVRARRAAEAARQEAEAQRAESDERLRDILRAQTEMTGRMQTMAEIFGSRQADLTRALSERMDGLTSRVGQSIMETTRETKASLGALSERLAVIDRAQGQIANLAGEVVRLQDILANKQTRGAFGQARMEAIVMDALPPGAYSFQATLSNGKRPDCLIPMPNGAPALAIDAKFPLEAWTALGEAAGDEARNFAVRRLKRDMDTHIKAIAEKYLIPGETQDTAFLFVPSESIFAALYEDHAEIVQRAHKARVVIVSPSLLMLSIQVVQAILKDARMKEEAGRIQREVRLLMEDLGRLDARVVALKGHFGQTERDIDQILTSTEKLIRRGERIEAVDLGEDAPGPAKSADRLAGI
ncbi:DNA recombination protein RmuC [Consotaella aegiceratis]|uniref:DNA recombination protein RmuC n=1 Tax=Consotaella aegiceratis TaxID=3097961 RepID=UPI002F3FD7A9